MYTKTRWYHTRCVPLLLNRSRVLLLKLHHDLSALPPNFAIRKKGKRKKNSFCFVFVSLRPLPTTQKNKWKEKSPQIKSEEETEMQVINVSGWSDNERIPFGKNQNIIWRKEGRKEGRQTGERVQFCSGKDLHFYRDGANLCFVSGCVCVYVPCVEFLTKSYLLTS